MLLKEIRVLDFSQYLAGPTVTRLMAEMGAEIFKVERAKSGDPSRLLPAIKNRRSGYFVQQNLGKKSICLDFSKKESHEIILKLVERVDVVVENFGPGVMEKRGWGYEELIKINPKLVMASISAFGKNNIFSHKTGFDWIAQAFSGVMEMTGPENGTPHPVGLGIADVSAGVHAFAAIRYSLFYRERTGKPQNCDISMIDCLFHANELNLQVPQILGDKFAPFRMGAHHKLLCPCGVFQAPDGFITILCTQGQWGYLCEAMSMPELEKDKSFKSPEDRVKNQESLIAIIEKWMVSVGSNDEILLKLERSRVPCAPVLNPIDAINHPYFRDRGVIREINDKILGSLSLPGFPLRFSSQKDYKIAAAPFLGQHNKFILQNLIGFSDKKIQSLLDNQVIFSDDL